MIKHKHNMTESPEYIAWEHIKTRCYNKNVKDYKNYGDRGITVCERWLNSFPNFLEDMGLRPSDKHSIDRIDNNGNYTPENCKWSTKKEQCNNKRNNHILEFAGEKLNITQWSEKTGLSKSVIQNRIKLGWEVEKILTTPVLHDHVID